MSAKILRVLLLEDDPADAELVAETLVRGGMPVVTERVDSRDAFTRALREFAPDVVLSDGGLFLLALAAAGLLSAMVAVGSYRLTEIPAIELTKKLITLLKNRHSQDGRASADSRQAKPDAKPNENQSPSIRKAA